MHRATPPPTGSCLASRWRRRPTAPPSSRTGWWVALYFRFPAATSAHVPLGRLLLQASRQRGHSGVQCLHLPAQLMLPPAPCPGGVPAVPAGVPQRGDRQQQQRQRQPRQQRRQNGRICRCGARRSVSRHPALRCVAACTVPPVSICMTPALRAVFSVSCLLASRSHPAAPAGTHCIQGSACAERVPRATSALARECAEEAGVLDRVLGVCELRVVGAATAPALAARRPPPHLAALRAGRGGGDPTGTGAQPQRPVLPAAQRPVVVSPAGVRSSPRRFIYCHHCLKCLPYSGQNLS